MIESHNHCFVGVVSSDIIDTCDGIDNDGDNDDDDNDGSGADIGDISNNNTSNNSGRTCSGSSGNSCYVVIDLITARLSYTFKEHLGRNPGGVSCRCTSAGTLSARTARASVPMTEGLLTVGLLGTLEDLSEHDPGGVYAVVQVRPRFLRELHAQCADFRSVDYCRAVIL